MKHRASEPTISGSADVPTSAAAVYGWISDLDTFAGFTEETREMRWVSRDAASAGARFRGANRNGWHRWSTTCTVTDAEPGARFGFDVVTIGTIPVAHWEYLIEATGPASCRVTESTWDQRPGWFKRPAALATGVRDRDRASRDHIAATLDRIRRYAEAH